MGAASGMGGQGAGQMGGQSASQMGGTGGNTSTAPALGTDRLSLPPDFGSQGSLPPFMRSMVAPMLDRFNTPSAEQTPNPTAGGGDPYTAMNRPDYKQFGPNGQYYQSIYRPSYNQYPGPSRFSSPGYGPFGGYGMSMMGNPFSYGGYGGGMGGMGGYGGGMGGYGGGMGGEMSPPARTFDVPSYEADDFIPRSPRSQMSMASILGSLGGLGARFAEGGEVDSEDDGIAKLLKR